ncbi:hypothetical protein JOF56_000743 [Kibdelosporangium banguiense]|uniref:Uncharacterized protein n=1 Tax=Kibdelosporangium banguiense TaxID=1365924 RepID=A0ABS4T7H0_9PSEU|nr:hypothetical protein [Kibdelosporangium banguiense]MBP2320358.1 hypothetical protein [Kibdelosporangium banguiense]
MESRRRTGFRRVVLTGAMTILAGIGSSMLLPLMANAATSDPPPPRRPTVSTLYRGDSRPPSEIFRNGFSGRGSDTSLVRHVRGGSGAMQSAYISTSEDQGQSLTFAASQGANNLVTVANACRGRAARPTNPFSSVWTYFVDSSRPGCSTGRSGYVTAQTYIYEIDARAAGNAYHVGDLFADHPDLQRYAGQREWAYQGRIPASAIIRVQVYETTVRVVYNSNGVATFPDFRNQPSDWHRVPERAGQQAQQNPNYHPGSPSRIIFPAPGNGTRPGAGGSSSNPRDHVGTSSHDELKRRRLNQPKTEPGAANPWTRGCSAITRCRS